jgi:hypothetical protein
MHIVLVKNAEGSKLLARTTHRWEDNIEMDIREIGWGGIYWIDLA